jgi:hypothetical protein
MDLKKIVENMLMRLDCMVEMLDLETNKKKIFRYEINNQMKRHTV